jgi:hypothetical protein
MENMEFLKAMLAEMNAKINATQERMDANNKATQEMMERQIGSLDSIMEADRKTNRRNETRNKSQPSIHASDDQNQSRKDGGHNTVHAV